MTTSTPDRLDDLTTSVGEKLNAVADATQSAYRGAVLSMVDTTKDDPSAEELQQILFNASRTLDEFRADVVHFESMRDQSAALAEGHAAESRLKELRNDEDSLAEDIAAEKARHEKAMLPLLKRKEQLKTARGEEQARVLEGNRASQELYGEASPGLVDQLREAGNLKVSSRNALMAIGRDIKRRSDSPTLKKERDTLKLMAEKGDPEAKAQLDRIETEDSNQQRQLREAERNLKLAEQAYEDVAKQTLDWRNTRFSHQPKADIFSPASAS